VIRQPLDEGKGPLGRRCGWWGSDAPKWWWMYWLIRNAKTSLAVQPEGKVPSWEPRELGGCYKMCVEGTECACGSRQTTIIGFCWHGDEFTISVQGEELLDSVSYCQLRGAPFAISLLHLQAASNDAQLVSEMRRHDVSFGDVNYLRVQRKGMNHVMTVRLWAAKFRECPAIIPRKHTPARVSPRFGSRHASPLAYSAAELNNRRTVMTYVRHPVIFRKWSLWQQCSRLVLSVHSWSSVIRQQHEVCNFPSIPCKCFEAPVVMQR